MPDVEELPRTIPVYCFDRASSEYCGEAVAERNPAKPEDYLVPAFATAEAPPAVGEYEAAVFQDGAWSVVSDHRGTEYWLPDGTKEIVEGLGEEVPEGAELEAPAPLLADIQRSAIARVNAAAEASRQAFLTPGAGQALTYQEKVSEAVACLEDTAPSSETFPMLAASLNIDADTLQGVASVVLARRDAWLQIGASIEATRLTANAAIEAAADEDGVDAILEALAWPEPGA